MKVTLADQTGHLFDFKQSPKRIVSLVPSQTELLSDLGLAENIVGITKFCVHPFHLKSTKTIVGGTKKVNYDKIRSLKPDLIICNKEENTLDMVETLSEICPVWVTNIITVEDNFVMISDFGKIFNKRTEALKWNDKLAFALQDFRKFMSDKTYRKTAYFIWKNPFMAAGSDNYIDEMMKLNHFMNIYENKSRYPEIDITKMRDEGDPELVLLSSEPYPFKEEDAFEIGRFTHHAKTVFVDGEMFSWYGSRMMKALAYFKNLQERI